MTQLAKRSKNVSITDAAFAVGVSSSGPSFFQIGLRSNSFSSLYSNAGQFHRLNDVASSIANVVKPIINSAQSVLVDNTDALDNNPDQFYSVLQTIN